jgi:hypothetical protein
VGTYARQVVVRNVTFEVAVRFIWKNADVSGDMDFGDDGGLRERGDGGREEEDGPEDEHGRAREGVVV